MTVDEIIIEPGDPNSPFKPKFGKQKFSNIEVAIFVGLLCGIGLIGFYLVGLGINNMMEPPTIIANGTIDGDDYYQISYNDAYYKSDKRNEITISNNLIWDANNIFIGSPEEYMSYRDMKLMDGQTHSFSNSNGKFMIGDIKYKRVLKYYGQYESPIADMTSATHKIVVVINNDKDTAKIYKIDLTGNVTSPKFTMTLTDEKLSLGTGTYARSI